ncbi:MAG: TIGR00266 family protein [Pirellulaceae bacterium]
MKYLIKHAASFPILEIELDEGERILSQPNSMLSMSAGIRLTARVGRRGSKGGWLSGFKNMLGGESLFTTEYTAKRAGQTVTLSPDSFGEILTITLDEEHSYFLTAGSYLANTGDCELGIKYGGVKGVMAKKGLFLLHAKGTGTVFCQTYGAIEKRELVPEEVFIVDNRFVVAFSDTVKYQLVKASENLKDSFVSGEGLVNRYTGPGVVYYQTRAKPSYGVFGTIFRAMT